LGPERVSSRLPMYETRRWKEYDRRALIDSTPKKDEGTQGEKGVDIDLMGSGGQESFFPDADLPNKTFNGIKFSDLPICHIKTTKNNTIMHLANKKGETIAYHSCGFEGFKNTRKGTNIAAQTTAITLANKAKEKGATTINVLIKGIGPGRTSSVKGLQMAGMTIVAITDRTPIVWRPTQRARKARRL